MACGAPVARAGVISLGDVFAGIDSGGMINHYNAAGTLLETLSTTGGTFTTGMAFDASGNLYATNFSDGTITKFLKTSTSTKTTVASGILGSPESISRAADGSWYVGGPGFVSGGSAYIQHFTPSWSSSTKIPVAGGGGTGGSDWVDLAANQTTLYYASEGKAIKRYDTVGGQLSDFNAATLPGTNAFALRILGDGSVLVADAQSVLHLDASGAVIKSYDPGGFGSGGSQQYFALNLDPNGTSFWTGDSVSGKLFKVNILTGVLEETIQAAPTGGELFGVAVAGEITAGGGGVPEPATMTLCAFGAAGLLGYGWRRRKQASA
jgi:YD repeat-containing protein